MPAALPDAPQVPAEPAAVRHVLEGGEHRLVAVGPVGGERPVGLGVALAADRGDRRAGAVEVDVEGDRLLLVGSPGRRTVRSPTGPCRGSVRPHSSSRRSSTMPGVPHHDVRARAAVDEVARPALDGGHRAAERRCPSRPPRRRARPGPGSRRRPARCARCRRRRRHGRRPPAECRTRRPAPSVPPTETFGSRHARIGLPNVQPAGWGVAVASTSPWASRASARTSRPGRCPLRSMKAGTSSATTATSVTSPLRQCSRTA